MRSYEQISDDADSGTKPFSNSTDFEIFAEDHCWDCVNDDEENERYCPILSVAIGVGWPKEWTRRRAGKEPTTFEVVDVCTEFEERRDDDGDDDPEPEPEPPPVVEGQLDLIDAYLDTAITELTSEPSREVSGV